MLEPSFGTGNFVNELKKESNIQIDAVEIDKEIYKPINGVNTICADFLKHKFNKKYKFIVGNPPYIELTYSFYDKKKVKKITEQQKGKGRGRINLVHLFFDKSFELLENNGVIAFLLPTIILTSPWYNEIRKTIYDHYTVLSLVDKVPFKDVSINVCLLIIQKKVDTEHNFIQKVNDFYFLGNVNSTGESTLAEKGFKCFVGDILWYKVKEHLSDSPINNKTLVYTNNIKNTTLDFNIVLRSKIEGKKQYITTYNGDVVKNCIITPRVIGKKMRHVLLLDNNNLVFENHVLVITHDDPQKLIELDNIITTNIDQFSQYFNKTNLTATELLNYKY